MRLTLSPRLSSRHPIEAAARPLPKEDTTPPVTKMYFADIASSLYFGLENCAGWRARSIMAENGAEGKCGKSGRAGASMDSALRRVSFLRYSARLKAHPVIRSLMGRIGDSEPGRVVVEIFAGILLCMRRQELGKRRRTRVLNVPD